MNTGVDDTTAHVVVTLIQDGFAGVTLTLQFPSPEHDAANPMVFPHREQSPNKPHELSDMRGTTAEHDSSGISNRRASGPGMGGQLPLDPQQPSGFAATLMFVFLPFEFSGFDGHVPYELDLR